MNIGNISNIGRLDFETLAIYSLIIVYHAASVPFMYRMNEMYSHSYRAFQLRRMYV